MRFTQWSIAAALASVATAAPSGLLFQNDAPLRQRPVAADEAQHRLADLSVDDFHRIQNSIKESLEHAVDEGKRVISDTFDILDDFGGHEHHKHPIHPPFLDFSNLTILEIVNASFAHEFGRKLRRDFPHSFDIDEDEDNDKHGHKPDPEHLPFHRLAGLLNFSPGAAELLDGDDVTFFAPDDWALTPPHKRKEHHGGRAFAHVEAEEDEAPVPTNPHPFHLREFSPKRLSHYATESVDGDDDEDKKKEFLKKVVEVIAKYHTLPGTQYPHQLADRSTAGTLLHDSRVRIEPAIDPVPFPHPTLRINHYAWQRGGLVIKAKNGVIIPLSAPLLPPLDPLNHLFLAPQFFSAFTSDVQKVDLDEVLLPKLPEHAHLAELDVNPLIANVVDELAEEHKLKQFTVFAPTNAFLHHVDPKIVAGLHLPFPLAKKILKYVLGYHIVPDVTFYSDYFKQKAEEPEEFVSHREVDVEVPIEFLLEGPPPHSPPHHTPHQRANVTHYTLPTLITPFAPNATIKAAVFEYRLFGFGPKRRTIVIFPHALPKHGEEHKDRFGGDDDEHHHRPPPIKVAFPDLPARAGAIHVLADKVLLPPPPPHHDEKAQEAFIAAHDLTAAEAKKFRKAVAKLFSHA